MPSGKSSLVTSLILQCNALISQVEYGCRRCKLYHVFHGCSLLLLTLSFAAMHQSDPSNRPAS